MCEDQRYTEWKNCSYNVTLMKGTDGKLWADLDKANNVKLWASRCIISDLASILQRGERALRNATGKLRLFLVLENLHVHHI